MKTDHLNAVTLNTSGAEYYDTNAPLMLTTRNRTDKQARQCAQSQADPIVVVVVGVVIVVVVGRRGWTCTAV